MNKMKNRQAYNRKIVSLISDMVEKCPDMRFIQLLWALGIVNREDRFYEESEETNEIVIKNMEKVHNEQ